MAQFYSLEEAARVLGMGPEELKAKAQHREVRAFLDGGSWRFRVADVDELARRRGLGSDPELPMSDMDPTMPSSGESGIDFSKFQLGLSDDLGGPAQAGEGAPGTDSDHELLLDDLKLPQNPGVNSSSVIIGMAQEGKRPNDSDIRLAPTDAKGGSDSDVRLAPAPPKPSDSDVRLAPAPPKPSDSDVTLFAEETSEHGFPGSGSDSGSGDTGIGASPFSGSSAEVVDGGPDSDFDLTPSNVIGALQPDSGSDFELTALDPSDEFDSTPMRGPGDSDVTAAEPGASGINLGRPSDSGINLLGSAGGFDASGGASSIELSPLSGSEINPAPAPRRGPSTEKPAPAARGKAEKDIFDDTDFEVDALGGEDKTVQLGPASDFELEEAESGSEVFAIDEDDVDQNAATAMSPGILEEEEDDAGFDDSSPSGEMSSSAWDVESESASSADRSGASPILAPSAATAEWGGLWVGLLGVTTVFMLLLTFISLDLVRNLYNYQGETPASGIVKSIAGLMGMGG